MDRKQRIYKILKKKLIGFSFKVYVNSHLHAGHNNFNGTGETHRKIILETNIQNLDRVNIHRKINNILENEFKNGLHSLEISIKKF